MKFQVWNSRSFINDMTYPYIRQGDFQMIPATDMKGDMICSD